MKRYEQIASTLGAIRNCATVGNSEWKERHEDTLDAIMETAPSGSGIDCGTKIDMAASSSDKLVFDVSFHHMDEMGGYDGWTEHRITVRASLAVGITLQIGGRNRNEIKDYLHEVYHYWLTEEETPVAPREELTAVPA